MSGTIEVGGATAEVTDEDLKAFQDTGRPEGGEQEKPQAAAPERDTGREEDDAPEGETEAERAERISASRARRERQKAAKERDRRELEVLRAKVADLENAVSRTVGATVDSKVAALDANFEQIKREYQAAEYAIANGATGRDLVEALARRDQAREAAERIIREKQVLQEAAQRRAPAPQQGAAPARQPVVTPEMRRHAESFMERVPFVQSEPASEDAETVKAIDAELTREGWDPRQSAYWDELHDRVKEALPHRFEKPKRSGPNLAGSSRSGSAPTAAANPLTPDRIAAMKEAGMWDDPKKREAMIARYREYDKVNSAR